MLMKKQTRENKAIDLSVLSPCFTSRYLQKEPITAWKVSNKGVLSGPYFPAFGLNTERYGVYGPEKTPYLDTFHAVNFAAGMWKKTRSAQI